MQTFCPRERAAEKEASRDRDLARLRSGEVTAAELQRENSFFAPLNLRSFRITHIGGVPVEKVR